jgi:hypothetical protein
MPLSPSAKRRLENVGWDAGAKEVNGLITTGVYYFA